MAVHRCEVDDDASQRRWDGHWVRKAAISYGASVELHMWRDSEDMAEWLLDIAEYVQKPRKNLVYAPPR